MGKENFTVTVRGVLVDTLVKADGSKEALKKSNDVYDWFVNAKHPSSRYWIK